MTGLLLAVTGVDVAHPLPNLTVILTVLNSIMAWLYFAGFESSARQATPGKRVLGIRVTDEDGDRLSFVFTSVRFCAKLLAGPLLVGFLIAAFNARKQALHDMAAGSLVVRG